MLTQSQFINSKTLGPSYETANLQTELTHTQGTLSRLTLNHQQKNMYQQSSAERELEGFRHFLGSAAWLQASKYWTTHYII